MGKVIVVASGKGGTGKTTTVAALASCLAALGHKTLCIDCDAGLKSLDIALCMSEYVVSDFADVLEGRTPLREACTESPQIPELYFLPAPTFRGPEELDRSAMAALADEIRERFDYCLIDAPSGIGEGLRLAASGADMALIVSTCDLASMRDAQRTAEMLGELGIGEMRLIINRVAPESFRMIKTTVDDIIDVVGVQLIGLVREDESVFFAPHMNIPLILHEKRRAAYNFFDIARRLTGEDIPLKWRRW